jgi:hypothetical protein
VFEVSGKVKNQVYVGCCIYMAHTYAVYSIDRAHTYMSCSIYRSLTYWVLLLQTKYRYRLVIGQWHRLVTGCWHKLVQVYSGISHNEIVTMVSSFHLYFRVVRQGRDKWLQPPFSCSRRT